MTHTPAPDEILQTYRSGATIYAATRSKTLFELPMLRALCCHARGLEISDIGCGPGEPLALWLARHGFRMTGVDGAAPMLELYHRTVPGARTVQQDMRSLSLRRRFDVVLAWDSFFHLSPSAQLRVFHRFAAHMRPGGVLVFSSGPERGVAYGFSAGGPVYHASHDPLTYRTKLRAAGFQVLQFRPNDPVLDYHSWWICRYVGTAPRRGY